MHVEVCMRMHVNALKSERLIWFCIKTYANARSSLHPRAHKSYYLVLNKFNYERISKYEKRIGILNWNLLQSKLIVKTIPTFSSPNISCIVRYRVTNMNHMEANRLNSYCFLSFVHFSSFHLCNFSRPNAFVSCRKLTQNVCLFFF